MGQSQCHPGPPWHLLRMYKAGLGLYNPLSPEILCSALCQPLQYPQNPKYPTCKSTTELTEFSRQPTDDWSYRLVDRCGN